MASAILAWIVPITMSTLDGPSKRSATNSNESIGEKNKKILIKKHIKQTIWDSLFVITITNIENAIYINGIFYIFTYILDIQIPWFTYTYEDQSTANNGICCDTLCKKSWILKREDWKRTDAFELWCWRKLARMLWTMNQLNKWIIKHINAAFSFKAHITRLNLSYFGHIMQNCRSLEKSVMVDGFN